MAEEYRKISQLTLTNYDELTGSEEIPFRVATSNGRTSINELIKKFLGIGIGTYARSIGLNESGSIVVTDSDQVISNKDITKSKLNGVAIGSSITGTILNCLEGLSGNLVSLLGSITSRISTLEQSKSILATTHTFFANIKGEDKTFTINAKDIMSQLGTSSATYIVVANSIQATLYNANNLGSNKRIDFPSELYIHYDVNGGLARIEIVNLPAGDYVICITFTVGLA